MHKRNYERFCNRWNIEIKKDCLSYFKLEEGNNPINYFTNFK